MSYDGMDHSSVEPEQDKGQQHASLISRSIRLGITWDMTNSVRHNVSSFM